MPTIHVDDLTEIVFNLAFSKEEGFFYGVDHSSTTQKDLVQGISQTLGNGHYETKLIEDGFLHEYFDIFTADFSVDEASRPQLDEWKAKDGLVANMGSVVAEFNAARGLKPNKILIHGTPSSGKSKLAQLYLSSDIDWPRTTGCPSSISKGLLTNSRLTTPPLHPS